MENKLIRDFLQSTGNEGKGKDTAIDCCRKEYPVPAMCKFFLVFRSGYYSFAKRMHRPEKEAVLAETIRQQQRKCFHTDGYRRMWQWLKRSEGIKQEWHR